MNLDEFLDCGLRFATHAVYRTKRRSRCGIDLFLALKRNKGQLNDEGITYHEQCNALRVSKRKGLNYIAHLGVAKTEYTDVSQFDSGRVFMESIVRLAAHPQFEEWFLQDRPLPLLPDEAKAIGSDTPTVFRGILLTCYEAMGKGELWFAIADKEDFIEQFRAEAQSCMQRSEEAPTRDRTVWEMPGFEPVEQFALLGLGQAQGKDDRTAILAAAAVLNNNPEASAVWHTEEEVRALNVIMRYVQGVPRASNAADREADDAEALVAKILLSYSVGPAVHLRSDLMRVTKGALSAAVAYIIESRDPKKAVGTEDAGSSTRARLQHLGRRVPRYQHLVLRDGQRVKDVAQLAAMLDGLDDDLVAYHAERNDFQEWIRDVFQDDELAEKVRGVKDKRKLQLLMYRHMA